MFVGPTDSQSEVILDGVANAFSTRVRSRTNVRTGASLTGQALRAWNQTLRALWCESRTGGACAFFRGPGTKTTSNSAWPLSCLMDDLDRFPVPAFAFPAIEPPGRGFGNTTSP